MRHLFNRHCDSAADAKAAADVAIASLDRPSQIASDVSFVDDARLRKSYNRHPDLLWTEVVKSTLKL